MSRQPTHENALADWVRGRFGESARIEKIERIGEDGGDKAFGYGRLTRIELSGASTHQIVLHLANRGGFGHDTLADRASESLIAWETFNNLPSHAHALDVGAIDADGKLTSLGHVEDFYLVTAYARGEPFFKDFARIAETGEATDEDFARIERLAGHLATIHRDKKDAPELYLRRLRDLVGHHECIAGLIDSYDGHSEPGVPPRDTFARIEHWACEQRHLHKKWANRLCRVHGDFHPWNVLFDGVGLTRRFTLLDRSRGEWGEAADDLAAMSVNHLFFALRGKQDSRGPLARLFRHFFDTYLEATADRNLADVIGPYFVWRALVVASPVWYPRLEGDVRRHLFTVIERIMRSSRFDLKEVGWLFDRGSAEGGTRLL